MIIQIMMIPFWFLISSLMSLLPVTPAFVSGFGALTDLVGYGCAIIGTDFVLGVLGNITFWMTAQMMWALIEWVYKKLPGVN